MKVAVDNLGQIVSGDWHNPVVAGDTVIVGGKVSVGIASSAAVNGADVVRVRVASRRVMQDFAAAAH